MLSCDRVCVCKAFRAFHFRVCGYPRTHRLSPIRVLGLFRAKACLAIQIALGNGGVARALLCH
eukprot:2499369-Rhodomonas_salina.4